MVCYDPYPKALLRTHLGFPKVGIPFRAPHNKDCSMLGSISGPYLGEPPHCSSIENPTLGT